MSAIEKELNEATDISRKRGEEDQDYLARLMKATAKLNDKEWEGLSEATQDWYNDNAEKRNKDKKAGKDPEDTKLNAFPDAEQAEEEAPARRSRRGDDDGDAGKGKSDEGKAASPDNLKKGQRVKITNKRGKVFEGEVTALDKECVTVGDDEIDLDRIDTIEIFHGTAGTSEESDADPIQIGAEVEVTTKRGKTFVGDITELTDDELTIATDDGPEDFQRSRIETIKVLKAAKGGKAAAKGKDEPAGKDKGDDKPADTTKSKRVNNDGVSIGQRIKELIAENMDSTEAEIGKLLTKEKLDFKDNTLKLNFVDVHKTLAVLAERKLIKGYAPAGSKK